ncbi:MAG: HigA family addiction module antidote protein [Burkholderiales bacterium]|nr:HigA family addiction module antidote protein [Burkholderiales bacterium]
MLSASRTITNEALGEKGMTMDTRIPAEVFAPGEFLADELEARGWSQVELAEILGRPPRLISEIIAGKRAITPETAMGLAAAFGTSPQVWMNLETSYQLSRTKGAEQAVSRRARLYGRFPVKELVKRGWVEFSGNVEVLEKRFLDYFNMKSIDDTPTFACAARKSDYSGDQKILELAWLNRAWLVAKAVRAAKYSDAGLKAAIPELRECMQYKEEIGKVSDILAGAGVRLVVVEHLARSKMDACCFWIDGSPVIALSLRFDRIDNFWFNLFHEIDHVLHGEGKDAPRYETIDPNAEGLPPEELRANANASNYCVPRDELEGFIARVGPMYSKQAIIGFAMRIKVHRGIVVGQLQGRGVIHYSTNREMLERVKDVVTSSVLTDGFGNSLPLERKKQ